MKDTIQPETGGLELMFTVVVEPEDGGGYYAHCPGLKGIHVDGRTVREALNRAIEAAGCYLEAMSQRKEAFPVASPHLRVRPQRRPRVQARRYEVQWPSLRMCGTR